MLYIDCSQLCSVLLGALKSCVSLGAGDPASRMSVAVHPVQSVSLPALSGPLDGPEEDNSEAGSPRRLGFLSGKSMRKDQCVGWLLGVKMQL